MGAVRGAVQEAEQAAVATAVGLEVGLEEGEGAPEGTVVSVAVKVGVVVRADQAALAVDKGEAASAAVVAAVAMAEQEELADLEARFGMLSKYPGKFAEEGCTESAGAKAASPEQVAVVPAASSARKQCTVGKIAVLWRMRHPATADRYNRRTCHNQLCSMMVSWSMVMGSFCTACIVCTRSAPSRSSHPVSLR